MQGIHLKSFDSVLLEDCIKLADGGGWSYRSVKKNPHEGSTPVKLQRFMRDGNEIGTYIISKSASRYTFSFQKVLLCTHLVPQSAIRNRFSLK